MAVRDVRRYYAKCVNQKIELQEDLKDFEEALKNGYITEDKLEDVKIEFARMQENIDRLAYILYLLELPNRSQKKEKFKKGTAILEAGFDKLNASEQAILDENKSIQAYIREELAKRTKLK